MNNPVGVMPGDESVSLCEPRESPIAFAVGVILLAVGFPSLLLVDARAENGWTFFACAAIILGYTAFAVSILTRRD